MEAKEAPGTPRRTAGGRESVPSESAEDSARSCFLIDAYRWVAEVSSEFVVSPLQKLDEAIDATLASLAERTASDRAYFILFSEDGLVLEDCHEYAAPGLQRRTDAFDDPEISALLPRLSQIVQRQEVFRIEDTTRLPAILESASAYFARPPARSCMLAAIEGAAAPCGFLGLETAGSTAAWGEETEALLRGLGRIFLSAVSRRLHAEALAFERTLMAALMENIPDAIYFKDRQSRFTRISRALARLFGLDSPDAAIGRTDADFFTEEHARQALEDEEEIIRTGSPLVGKVEKETWPDRPETWVSTTKMPLYNAEGEIVGTFGISRNVTESKRMAEAIERQARQLSLANEALELRNQELDEFTYIASHDLQEPLRKISAFSDLLREDIAAGNSEDVEHDIDVLAGAARRMQRLVQDLLALSRSGRQAMHIEPLELDRVVDDALDALEVRVAETGAVILRERLPLVLGDRTLLVQLYQNLIGNGLKFIKKAPPHIALTVEPEPGGAWLLGVRDEGIGLKPEYAEQIFAPFKRLHGRDEYEGTGIGLAICRKIVERHNGRIWVESELGQGAHFRFILGNPAPGDTP